MTKLAIHINVSKVTHKSSKISLVHEKYGYCKIPIVWKISLWENLKKQIGNIHGNNIYYQYLTDNLFTKIFT